MQMDMTTIYKKIQAVMSDYESKRVNELLSPAKGSSRISTEQLQTITGKAQGCRELATLLYNEFGFTV